MCTDEEAKICRVLDEEMEPEGGYGCGIRDKEEGEVIWFSLKRT